MGVIGILAGLAARARSGAGQHIDVALLDSPVSWSLWEASQYFGSGKVPQPIGSSHRNVAPDRAFVCSDERYLVVGAASQQLWESLCAVVERPALLTDERFSSADLRRQHRETLEESLEEVFWERPRQDRLELLGEAGIPTGPVYRYDEVVADEQVRHRGLVAEVEHPVAGPMELVDVPLFMSGTPREPIRSAPLLGADTNAVLGSLGLDTAQIERLNQSGAVFDAGWSQQPPGQ